MKKSDWEKGLKKLKELLKVCEKNIETATDQKEELDFTIAAYIGKIETFK